MRRIPPVDAPEFREGEKRMMNTQARVSAAENPSTWSITYLPSGTPVRYYIDAEVQEIRIVLGEPELAELAMPAETASNLRRVLENAIGDCDAELGSNP